MGVEFWGVCSYMMGLFHVKSQSVLQLQTFHLEKSHTDTEMTPLVLCSALYFDVNQTERICVDSGITYTWDSGHSKQKGGHTVISLVSNPKSIGAVKTKGLMVLELVPHRDLDPENAGSSQQ